MLTASTTATGTSSSFPFVLETASLCCFELPGPPVSVSKGQAGRPAPPHHPPLCMSTAGSLATMNSLLVAPSPPLLSVCSVPVPSQHSAC